MKVPPFEPVKVIHPGSPASAEVVGGWVVVGGASDDEGDVVSGNDGDVVSGDECGADAEVEGDSVPLSVVTN